MLSQQAMRVAAPHHNGGENCENVKKNFQKKVHFSISLHRYFFSTFQNLGLTDVNTQQLIKLFILSKNTKKLTSKT